MFELSQNRQEQIRFLRLKFKEINNVQKLIRFNNSTFQGNYMLCTAYSSNCRCCDSGLCCDNDLYTHKPESLGAFFRTSMAIGEKKVLFKFIKQLFKRSRQQVQHVPHEQHDESCNIPPRVIPIETVYEATELPGSSDWIGEIAKVFQTFDGDQVTLDRKKGIRCDCGHTIYQIDEEITTTSIKYGLGGECSDCKAEGKSGYFCSQCKSHCQKCNRKDLCAHHTQSFTDINDKEWDLCPACYKKADTERFFKKTLSVMLWPFLENNNQNNSKKDEY